MSGRIGIPKHTSLSGISRTTTCRPRMGRRELARQLIEASSCSLLMRHELWRYVAVASIIRLGEIFKATAVGHALKADRDHAVWLHYEEKHGELAAERDRIRWCTFDMSTVSFTETNHAVLRLAPLEKSYPTSTIASRNVTKTRSPDRLTVARKERVNSSHMHVPCAQPSPSLGGEQLLLLPRRKSHHFSTKMSLIDFSTPM